MEDTYAIGHLKKMMEDCWLQTLSGQAFWPLEPERATPPIEDFAASLSKLCRFAGHCKRFYSVAEHCVLMARNFKVNFGHPTMRQVMKAIRRGLLMHDITETIIPDFVRPIKHLLYIWTPDGMVSFTVFEEGLLEDLLMGLERQYDWSEPVSATGPTIKEIDSAMLATEGEQVMNKSERRWGSLPKPLPIELRCWEPEVAYQQFMECYDEYFVKEMGLDG
ncbi:hypothetical protein LCGC14_0747730 [marine sediment metagenome]|uniref:HD domain-containing protein n=1 Tax=marine sediment metagenome TaxID=412755 RepID=A0A0F9SPV6_9ZZZZ